MQQGARTTWRRQQVRDHVAEEARPSRAATTTTPRQSTKTANAGWAAWTRPARRRRRAAAPNAPAPPRQRGDPGRLDPERRERPRSRPASARPARRHDGQRGGCGPGAVPRRGPRGRARNSRRSTTYSTTSTVASTGAITTAKPPKVRSRWGIASRLVRLETGSSSEAELAIRRQACAPGARGRRQGDGGRRATTGVSSTTVASRLSTVVTRGEQEDAGEQPHRPPAAGARDPVRGRDEDAGPGAHVGDHQDRDEEGDDRAELAQHVDQLVGAEHPGGEGAAAARQTDQGLDPGPRVAVRRDQQGQQRERGHQAARDAVTTRGAHRGHDVRRSGS